MNHFTTLLALPLLAAACNTAPAPATTATTNTATATSATAEASLAAVPEQPATTPEQPMNTATGDGLFAIIKTNMGTIKAKLEMEKTPLTVASFVGLAEGTLKNTFRAAGQPYFDGLQFHRVIKGFMIQGGDPTGTGSGGPGYQFDNEIVADLRHDKPGTLSMANAGANTNGSQFFITHVATPMLDGGYSVFGYVVEGQDVVNAIATTPTQPGDRPVTPMIMETVRIERVGAAAKTFNVADVIKQSGGKFRQR